MGNLLAVRRFLPASKAPTPMLSRQSGPILSPCIDVCRLNAATGLCDGCLRTLDEIGGWGGMSDARRAEIMAQLPARLRQLGSPIARAPRRQGD